MASAIGLPSELCNVPKPFIVLTGLDTTYNAVHKSIWDAFSNNRSDDRLNISFTCLPDDHSYPQSKSKRTSYDWYIPKGLLKSGWMKKHLTQVPAAVVVFFELNWDELAWRERHLACASRVQIVRSSLHRRTTKVAVVLIQKSSPLPPGEDMVAAERAAALCSACDLSAKSLFVLPHNDHLIGYIVRLESAFYDLALTYYHTECRRVKAHKEFLNKTTHQLLFPRHQFKIAFFNEQMQESATALKHYHQCYNHIHELRLNDSNNLELKMVGGFVNYKICKLCFLNLNAPVDAISQFQRHIELFKPLCGNNELLFEHNAWLSEQFLVFADLFNEAISSEGLTPVQTQHPGFYYQQAAHYAKLRKDVAKCLCEAVKTEAYPSNDPLRTETLDYYGQRPWRQTQQRIDLSDNFREREGILALKLKEASCDHSWQIIPLLNSAVTQFKKFHCPRLKRQLMIEMGEEYYHAGDYNKAITLLQRATAEYRNGRWCKILTRILKILLECAYITLDVSAYCMFASELLCHHSELSMEHKMTLQQNLLNIINGIIPQQLMSHHIENLSMADTMSKWDTLLCKLSPDITIEANDLVPFVECKVFFTQPHFYVDSCINLKVYTRITSPLSLQFTELSIEFSNYGYKCQLTDVEQLYHEPWIYKTHTFEFTAESISKTLSIESISMKIAPNNPSKGNSLVYKWHFSQINQPSSTSLLSTPKSVPSGKWSLIESRLSTSVVERQSKLEIEILHNPPALVGEVFPLRVCVSSNEAAGTVAENVIVLVSLKPGMHQDDLLFQDAIISLDAFSMHAGNNKSLELNFGDMTCGKKLEKLIFIKTNSPGVLRFSFQTSYNAQDVPVFSTLDNQKQLKTLSCSSSANTEVSFDVLPPFNFTAHVTSSNFESVSIINVGEPFFVITTLTLGSKWPVEIVSGIASLSCDDEISMINEVEREEMSLAEEEAVTHCINLVCRKVACGLNVCIGKFTVEWERTNQLEKVPRAATILKLPCVTLQSLCLHVTASLPAFGVLRKALEVSYRIDNQSNSSKQIEITYNSSDSFVFAGPKQSSNFLLPFCSRVITYNIIPLALGYQALPHFQIVMSQSQQGEDGNPIKKSEVFNTSLLPTHLIIKPALYESS